MKRRGNAGGARGGRGISECGRGVSARRVEGRRFAESERRHERGGRMEAHKLASLAGTVTMVVFGALHYAEPLVAEPAVMVQQGTQPQPGRSQQPTTRPAAPNQPVERFPRTNQPNQPTTPNPSNPNPANPNAPNSQNPNPVQPINPNAPA